MRVVNQGAACRVQPVTVDVKGPFGVTIREEHWRACFMDTGLTLENPSLARLLAAFYAEASPGDGDPVLRLHAALTELVHQDLLDARAEVAELDEYARSL